MTKIISSFNQAGGVAKTTLTHNLGFHLADRGNRVLLVDLDPQASLTMFMGLEPAERDKTIHSALSKDEPLPIEEGLEGGLDLTPSNILLADCEQELMFALQRELKLKQVLAPVRKKYDFILIDCPPSLGLLSLIALVASTHVLVPIETQYKAFKGTDSLLKTISKVQRLNKSLKIAGFVPTKYSSRNTLDQQVLEAIREQLSPLAPVFPPVPTATSLAVASKQGLPLGLCSGRSKNQHILELFDKLAEAMEQL